MATTELCCVPNGAKFRPIGGCGCVLRKIKDNTPDRIFPGCTIRVRCVRTCSSCSRWDNGGWSTHWYPDTPVLYDPLAGQLQEQFG